MAIDGQGVPVLDAAHQAVLRARPEAERARLHGLLNRLYLAERDGAPATDEPEDFSEMGRDLTQEDTDQALVADQERLLTQVDHALRRMEEGTYGLSEVSGQPIPLERLEALPWATTLVGEPLPR